MKTYPFEIHLQSDAEPSSGLGTELLNSLLPRNAEGNVTIPASHLKGLMRENLYRLLNFPGSEPDAVCNFIFGQSGENGDDGYPGIIHLTGASVENAKIITITRTKINEDGTAEGQSLRTTEALAAGTVLKGTLSCDSEDSQIQKLCRLALMSIFSIGGYRTRGAGACRINFPDFPQETPGKLLKGILNGEIKTERFKPEYQPTGDIEEQYKAVKLIFAADSPICLPERPHGKNNVISSGYVIPGTAVAGTILNILSETDCGLSSACYRAKTFRCYPLLPVMDPEGCQFPVLVPNSHKISKVPLPDIKRHLFGDLMIPDQYLEEDYHWQRKSSGISMKGASGVLQVKKDGCIELLRSGDITRYYSAHGVVNGSGSNGKTDNLFSMESVCVKHFSGVAVLPVRAADLLLEKLKNGKTAFFGKSKSTMGSGILTAEEFPLFKENAFPQVKQLKNRLFVVQTPIVYDSAPGTSTMDIINKVLGDAGWGSAEAESIMTSVLFGWNKLKIAEQINQTGRTKAKRVITPGSVFLLKEPVSDLDKKLAEGLGTDRYAGYGSVIPHPMFAEKLCRTSQEDTKNTVPCSKLNGAVYKAYELYHKNNANLSASQIAALMRQTEISVEKGLEFLKTQKQDRPAETWEKWESVHEDLKSFFNQAPKESVISMLRVWHDLRVGGF